MGWEAWFSIGIVILCFSVLATNRYAPDSVMMGGLTILLISGILTPQEALAGLANEGMVTVGVLYIVATGLQHTGGVAWLSHSLLGKPRSLSDAQLKIMLPVAGLSAFLNNTPIVALFIPAIQDWAKRHRLSVSKLMIPLSYAAIAGGTCTLIGTSTNLVVNGLLIEETGVSLSLFESAWVGIPVTVMVLLFTSLFSRCCLPERIPAISDTGNIREYTTEMQVVKDSPLVGKTIEEAGLRQLPGLYLMEIEREIEQEREIIPAVSPTERLHADDRLVFVGVIDSVMDLHKIRGLVAAEEQSAKVNSTNQDRHLMQAVVSNSCPLIGKSIREGRFRSRYNAAVIAVARNGERINRKIGDIILMPGDTLLLETHAEFMLQQADSSDFFLISHLGDAPQPKYKKVPIALGILIGMVTAVGIGWLSMLEAAMLAAGLMLVTRCTNGRIARQAIDWQVLVVIAASFGIGAALQKTGAAAAIAYSLITLVEGMPYLALAMIFAATALLSALATNNAAAVIMFPLALATAEKLGVNILPFAITVMIGASASFATPIGYQTNLMVYGPGGYRFIDYLTIGIPLTILVGIITVYITPLVWPF